MTKKRSYGEGTVLEWSGAPRKAVQDREAKIKVVIAKAPSPVTMTVRQLMAKWLTHKSKLQLKRSTLKTYSNFIRVHINPDIGDMEATKVVPEDIQSIQYKIVDRGHYRTAQQVLMVINAAFEYASKLYGHSFEFKNPAANIDRIPIPKVENPRDKPWTLEELDKFLQLAKQYYDVGQTLYYPMYCNVFIMTMSLTKKHLRQMPVNVKFQ